jgi:hypothetical protein
MRNMLTQKQDPRPRTHRLFFSRLLLSVGFLVIGGTALLTIVALLFGALIWQLFVLGLIIGIAAIVLSHLLISRPQREPNDPTMLFALAGLIVGYFIIIVAGLATLFQFFFANRLSEKIVPLFIALVGVGIVLWSKKMRE